MDDGGMGIAWAFIVIGIGVMFFVAHLIGVWLKASADAQSVEDFEAWREAYGPRVLP